MLRRISLILLKSITFFVLICFFYLLSAQALSALHTGGCSIKNDSIAVYIKSNGVHTDIVLPVHKNQIDWKTIFPHNSFPNSDSTAAYISFGWGDKGFYLHTPEWSDLKFSTAFNALFFLSSTAMHVTYKKTAPIENEGCRKVYIPLENYQWLCAGIYSSFKKQNGKIQLIKGASYWTTDNFYEAEGTYSFLKTCNVWTGDQLRNAGLRAGLWTPFDWNVLSSVN